MAAPSVKHRGFLIPNAQDVTEPVMAEPDRIDFNTVAHARYGVVEGCEVLMSTATASTFGGTALVNGVLVTVKAGSVNLSTAQTQDRFDLLVTDGQGTLGVIPGTPSEDPVFPDTPETVTLLAVAYCASGASDFGNSIIDKRVFVPQALLTKIGPDDRLIYNLNGSGSYFNIDGKGLTSWLSDTRMYRSGVAELTIENHLSLRGNLIAGGAITGQTVSARGTIRGSNLSQGDVFPPGTDHVPGTIFQHSGSGRIYTWRNSAWKELATLESASPVGSILTTLEVPEVMEQMGWISLNGTAVNEGTPAFDSLITLSVIANNYVVGVAPNRSIRLPNCNRRVMITDFSTPGSIGGQMTRSLSLAHMPAHKHNGNVSPGGGWGFNVRTSHVTGHRHSVWGGAHGHNTSDPTHQHLAAEFVYGHHLRVVAETWGGPYRLDGPFNDRSHPVAVDLMPWTGKSATGLVIASEGSDHGHEMGDAGAHDHTVSASAPAHDHGFTEESKGEGLPFDTTPAYIAVYTYIRS